MNALLIAAALGLAASLPMALVGFAAGAATDRLSPDPKLREAAWTAAFALPLLVLLGGLLLTALPREADGAHEAGAAFVQIDALALAPSTAVVTLATFNPLPLAIAAVTAALGGAGLRLARTLLGLQQLRRWVRRARPLRRADLEAACAAPELAAVLVSAEVDRPLLAGLRRPVVLLPARLEDRATADELALICAHAAAHALRGDNWRLVLESPVAGLFWFNPLAAAARSRLWAAREEVCDAIALASAPPAQRRRYAETLLDALRLSAGPGPQTAFTGARRNITMRLHAILDPALPAGRRAKLLAGGVALGLVLPLIGGVALATAALAAQGGLAARKSVHSYTSQVDKAPEISVRVGADDHEERPDGSAVSRGNVEVEVRNAPAGLIEVDGRPQPAGFNAAGLQGRIRQVESRGGGESGGEPVFNIVTRGPPSGSGAEPGHDRDAGATANFFAGLKPGEIKMLADKVAVFDDPRLEVFTGRPSIGGSVKSDPNSAVLINGRPAPEGFVLQSIAPETIDRIEVKREFLDGRPFTANSPHDAPQRASINVIQKTP